MPTSSAPRVTPDDLLAMPDGNKYELVNGELKELNVSLESSHIAGEVFFAVKAFCRANPLGWVFPEGTSFRCYPFDESRVRRPDTAFVALDRLTVEQFRRDGHGSVVPDLVVEVVSPNDTAYEVELKSEEWLAAGVRLLWVIHPSTRIIRTYDAAGGDKMYREKDTLPGNGVLPGFAVPVAELFRTPNEPDGRV